MPIELAYSPLERIPCGRPVEKHRFVTQLCRGKFVIDLGALDEDAWALKGSSRHWLHGRIAEVADEVLGIDNAAGIPPEGLTTGPRSVINRGDIYALDRISMDRKPEVVVAGELIEHLPDPIRFLTNLRSEERFAGATLILTTPNACSVHNVLLGLFSRESTDRGHVAIHSFKTLTTILRLAGIEDYEIVPYFARFPELALRLNGPARWGVWCFEKTVNFAERVVPTLSAGWVVTASL